MRYDDNKPKYIRYGIYALAIGLSFLLQSSSVAFPETFGARTFLLLPLSVCIAMHEREIPAAIFGAFSGLLWDSVSGSEGFNAVVIMILSAVCSILISHLMQNNIVTAFVLSAGAVFAYELMYIIVNFGFGNAGNPIKQVFVFYLPSFIYTMVFVPAYYYIVSHIFSRYKTE